MNVWIYYNMHYMGIWVYGYMDIWIYGYMDIWIYGYMDIYIEREICVYIYIHKYKLFLSVGSPLRGNPFSGL